MTGNGNRNGVWSKGNQKSCFFAIAPGEMSGANACLSQNMVRKPQIANGG